MLLETSFAISCFVSSLLRKSWGQIKQCLNSEENLCILNTFDKDVMSSHLLLTTLPASAGIISLKLDTYLAVSRQHLPVEIAGGCVASRVSVVVAKSKRMLWSIAEALPSKVMLRGSSADGEGRWPGPGGLLAGTALPCCFTCKIRTTENVNREPAELSALPRGPGIGKFGHFEFLFSSFHPSFLPPPE